MAEWPTTKEGASGAASVADARPTRPDLGLEGPVDQGLGLGPREEETAVVEVPQAPGRGQVVAAPRHVGRRPRVATPRAAGPTPARRAAGTEGSAPCQPRARPGPDGPAPVVRVVFAEP